MDFKCGAAAAAAVAPALMFLGAGTVSANAAGIAAIAEPTPGATASAPTRPT